MIRPVEAKDAVALHELLLRPETARRMARTPFDPLVLTRRLLAEPSGGAVHRLGLWRGERLVAAAGLSPGPRPRTAHEGTLWLAGEDDASEAGLLEALLDAADRWLGLLRVQLELEADDASAERLEALGFEREVRKRGHRFVDGALRDTAVLARLRPGWAPAPPPPAPEWPARGEAADAEVSVRAAESGDAAAHARTMRQPSVMWGTLQLPTTSEDLWRARLEANDPRDLRALVAELDGEVVGTAGLRLLPRPFDHGAVLGMSVPAERQGRGIGRVLLESLIELAERWLGLSRLELEVYTDNGRAVALYERHGFEVEGVRRRAVLRDGAFADVQVMSRLA